MIRNNPQAPPLRLRLGPTGEHNDFLVVVVPQGTLQLTQDELRDLYSRIQNTTDDWYRAKFGDYATFDIPRTLELGEGNADEKT